MADRLPPGQGALQNWNTPNLNKPEEYSSEFTVDGIRYANVTNVSTGQRQLYFVQSISGARGAPITTTNADGTKTPGGTYDNFNRNNPGKLAAAEAASKQASIKLLSTPGISTPAEAAAIKNSKEFKSTTAGNNAATGGPVGESAPVVNLPLSRDTKKGSAGSFRYPANLAESHQDIIKFNLVKYIPGGIPTPGSSGRPPSGEILGTVVLPVPNNISDTNTADWGADSMSALKAAGAAAVFETIGSGFGAGMESAEKSLNDFANNPATKELVKAEFTAAAMQGEGAKLLSRASGQIINPNLELLFNGPQLRPFNFTFKLAARSEGEGKTILEILRFFKRGMSPIRSESNLFLKSPNTFTIEYQHMGKTNPNIGKIKECALQSVTTSYTPEGQYATFSDGVMVSYSLQMTFTELEPIFNEDYEGLPGIGY
jgi:hypothetical protein